MRLFGAVGVVTAVANATPAFAKAAMPNASLGLLEGTADVVADTSQDWTIWKYEPHPVITHRDQLWSAVQLIGFEETKPQFQIDLDNCQSKSDPFNLRLQKFNEVVELAGMINDPHVRAKAIGKYAQKAIKYTLRPFPKKVMKENDSTAQLEEIAKTPEMQNWALALSAAVGYGEGECIDQANVVIEIARRAAKSPQAANLITLIANGGQHASALFHAEPEDIVIDPAMEEIEMVSGYFNRGFMSGKFKPKAIHGENSQILAAYDKPNKGLIVRETKVNFNPAQDSSDKAAYDKIMAIADEVGHLNKKGATPAYVASKQMVELTGRSGGAMARMAP